MARLQLRDTNIFLQDGLSGSAQVDEGNSSLAQVPVVTTTQGAMATDEVQTVVQYGRAPTGGTYTLWISDGTTSFTTADIAFNAAAAVIETAIDVAATAATYPAFTNGDITVAEVGGVAGVSDGGGVTLTYDGASVTNTNFETTIINGASLTGTTITGGSTLGLQMLVLNSDVTNRVPVGGRFTIATETGTPIHTITSRYQNPMDGTLTIAFTPAIASTVAESDAVVFMPQRLSIRIGDGDVTWTESREMIYDLDRDLLDSVREGQEQPVEIELNFVFEEVTATSGQPVSPVDALKRIGEATEWVSSSADLCQPYAVDLFVIHCVPCGTDQDQDFLFQDFRWESLDYSIQDAAIAVSGRCNVANITTTRGNFNECS